MCLGIPAQLIKILDAKRGIALVETGGVRLEADISALLLAPERISERIKGRPSDLIGAWTILHAGFALALLDEQAARETLAFLSRAASDADQKSAESGATGLTGEGENKGEVPG